MSHRVIGTQFALFGPHREVPQAPAPGPEIGVTPRDTSTQMWEGHSNPQLPMFLTAREIKHNYAPLSGDREYSEYGNVAGAETDDQLWERKAMEADDDGLTQHLNDQNWQFDRAIPLTRPPSHAAQPEPDSLGVRRTAFSKEPVDEELQGTYDDTRPQVLDGHHRIAAADDHLTDIGSPDALIPVVHVPPNRASLHIGKSASHL